MIFKHTTKHTFYYEALLKCTDTPSFVYDEGAILHSLKELQKICSKLKYKTLYSLKSFAALEALLIMTYKVDGFSSSSLFEAQLAREVLGKEKSVHLTTPGIRPDEIHAISELCDYISFNSLSQWEQYRKKVAPNVSCGLRINPQISLVQDKRYNPCRKYSKLGVPLDQLVTTIDRSPELLAGISGLHFHTNCDSSDFAPLLKTVKHLDAKLENFLPRIKWINLGGGYIFNKADNLDAFREAVNLLRSKYALEVFIEPGASIVREAGYLVSSVLDIFTSNGKKVAILDTTVNHMPEVFEYQFEPDVIEHTDEGKYEYILAGCTCLAGDVFGEYSFDEPLKVGSRVIFINVGAYTLVKAHMFNGVNLPSIYAYTTDGKLELKKRFTYEDFKSRCGGNNYVTA